MSGGYFDYNQYRIFDAATDIENIIKGREQYRFSEETLEEFMKAIRLLNKAATYLHRIDWLLEGDDGEDAFHRRLTEDLLKLFGEEEGE